jgi:hypothetical protein
VTTHTHHDQDAWDDNDRDQDRDRDRDQHARRHGRQHSYKRTRPAFRHDRPRLRPADGECGLRLIGVDGHCAGPRISLGNGRARNQRGCTEHAAQTLVRRPGWYITGGTPRARVELEAHMRAIGSWRPEMGRLGMGGRD